MRPTRAILGLVLTGTASAGTIWVDVNNTTGVEDGSAAYPYNTVQEGIDAAANGDEVVVLPGEYLETITFEDSDITSDFTLRSNDPLDAATVAATVINGDLDGDPATAEGRVVTLSGDEDATCGLSGLTITGGRTGEDVSGAGICGGGTGAAIRHCTITGNTSAEEGGGLSSCNGAIAHCEISGNSAAGYGGGLYGCNGPIEDCLIAENWGHYGGGLCYCDGSIVGCRITGNTADLDGGGLCACDGRITCCIVSGNAATLRYGGGFDSCFAFITNCVIAGNSADYIGGGLCCCGGTITNCTIVGNTAGAVGGLETCGAVCNCIIWGNTADDFPQMSLFSAPHYCCIQNWGGGHGSNIITQDPKLVDPGHWTGTPGQSEWVEGDYRLQAGSPCINAGRFKWMPWGFRDPDGNARLSGRDVDMGAYEYGSAPDADGDLLPDTVEAAVGTDPANPDSDGDGMPDGVEMLRQSNPHAADPPRELHVPAQFSTVQEAVGVAADGDSVILAATTYRELLVLPGRNITLRSEDPSDPARVAATIISGDVDHDPYTHDGAAVALSGDEGEACLLLGLTITDSFSAYGFGGGVAGHYSGASLVGCVISNNRAYTGGALAHHYGVISGCTITGNEASRDGGGLCRCYGYVHNCLFAENAAGLDGGAMCTCFCPVVGCTFAGNTAGYDGGAIGGPYAGRPLRNSIVWHNVSPGQWQVPPYPGQVVHCCIEDWDEGGEGNINLDPRFVTGPWGDYYLRHAAAGQGIDSPCIDAGHPCHAAFGTTRTDGGPDVGCVDMGYHYPVGCESCSAPPGWLRPGWNLVSLPLVPNGGLPDFTLCDICRAGNRFDSYNLLRYWPEAGVYDSYSRERPYWWETPFEDIGAGRGYWLRLEHGCECTMRGGQRRGEFPVALGQGWNCIGCPSPSPVPLLSCELDDGAQRLGFGDAAAAGWVQAVLLCYDPECGYGAVSPTPGDDDCLRPWYGYWLLAHVDGLTLIVP